MQKENGIVPRGTEKDGRRDRLDFPPPQQEIFLLLERKIAALTAEIAIEFPSAVQGREKLKELSFETHVPSAPIGCAWACHFAWQK